MMMHHHYYKFWSRTAPLYSTRGGLLLAVDEDQRQIKFLPPGEPV